MRTTNNQTSLSATDLSNHLSCKHLTALNLLASKQVIEKPIRRDHRVDRLVELGEAHEADYVKHLRAKGLRIVDWPSESDARPSAQRTMDAMQDGADVIVQAKLELGRWGGYADILRRVDKPGTLGNWSYEVVDTKLTSNTKGGTILQLCLYSDMVESIQGVRPEKMYVVSPSEDFAAEEFRFDDFAAYYRFVKSQLTTTIDEQLSDDPDRTGTYPYPVSHCDVCNWWTNCNSRRRTDDHLSFVANCSRLHVNTLEDEGIATLKSLANLALDDGKLPFKPRRGASHSYLSLQRQASLQLQQRETKKPHWEFREESSDVAAENQESREGFFRLPEPDPGDVFFDIEGDRFVGDVGLEYLFGYAISGIESGPPYRYEASWAFKPECSVISEKEMFETFIDRIVARRVQYPGMHIYHYNHYEPTNIKRLMSHHATREDEVDVLLRAGVFVDLYTVVRQAIRAGVESYSIKQLEQYYGYKRLVDLREDASPNLRLLEKALQTNRLDLINEEIREAVEGYNKDDCLSTAYLRDWLEGLRETRIAEGIEIPRPDLQSGDPNEMVDEKVRETREIVARLLSKLSDDQTAWSNIDVECWLLAQLLDWHRRESKVAIWEYYRLAGMIEEDLYDERAAIAGLHFESDIDSSKRLYEYSYPKQEVKLKKRDGVKSVDGEKMGTISSIDTIRRRVVLKKTKKQEAIHPRAIFEAGRFLPDSPRKALLRFGRFVSCGLLGFEDPLVSENDPDIWLTAARLLSRLAPAELLEETKAFTTPLERALYIAPRLDGHYLAIQGPPGSGKTYTGARMICELVRQGKTVGVCAISHKVIRNVLDEVMSESEKLGQGFLCVQKPANVAPKDDQHPRIAEVDDNKTVLAEIHSGNAKVFGGTGYLWTLPDMANSVDVLIVDEAGQMSLANVLAISQAGRSLILLGDPAQLDQPQKAAHPEGSDASALEYVLNGEDIMPDDQGLFIDETRRLHPSICKLTSELFYDSKLRSMAGLEKQQVNGHELITESGLYFLPVEHSGNRNESEEEAWRINELVKSFIENPRATWTDEDGKTARLTLNDILIVAPYNGHVTMLQSMLPDGARVGTVDKFQGQQAPIVIYSLAASSAADAPRGMDFLYNLNRLNVATSRAKCACILVASPQLLEPECKTPAQMRLANAMARYREMATVVA